MSSIFDNTDDLDPDFKPDPEVLKTTDGNKGQADSDTVLVTKVEKPIKPVEVDKSMRMDQMLASKLVMVQDGKSKVLHMQDLHDSLVAQESISRTDAENISVVCESFLGPRLKINEFTTVPSKVNYQYSKTFLEKAIAAEQAILTEMVNYIATEDVMQYASFISDKAQSIGGLDIGREPVTFDKDIKVLSLYDGSELHRISNITSEEVAALVAKCQVDQELKEALNCYSIQLAKTKLSSFVTMRISGASVDTAVSNTAICTEYPDFTIDQLLTYAKQYYDKDINYLKSAGYNFLDGEETVAAVVANASSDTDTFIKEAANALVQFRRIETIEELSVSLILSVKVALKLFDSMHK